MSSKSEAKFSRNADSYLENNVFDLFSLKERVVVITGGARGIGRCLVRRFLEKGYKVYAFDIDETELNHTVHTHLKQYTDKGLLGCSIADLRSVDDIQSKVEEAAKFLGGQIDVLINNGGIASPKWKDDKTMFEKETMK